MLECLFSHEDSLLQLKVTISTRDTVLWTLLSQDRLLGKKVPEAAIAGAKEGYRLAADWLAWLQEQHSLRLASECDWLLEPHPLSNWTEL